VNKHGLEMKYNTASKDELQRELAALEKKYNEYKAMGLKLDMSRGKPDCNQLNLSEGLLTAVSTSEECFTDAGVDCRNYGLPDGIPEIRKIFSDLFEIPAANIIISGPSSLRLMFDTVARNMIFGVSEGAKPWGAQGKIKFLCPVPGYDRHFAICEIFGIEMINIPMTPTGPDMDMIEKLASSDPQIKGIFCVPKYSNPTGITFSEETVRRFASLKTAAPDFRIFWDNAYAIHNLYDEGDKLLNLFDEAKAAGNPDIAYIFASFAKISFSGGGVSMFASSNANIDFARKIISMQTICCDKVNQLRHARFFKNAEGVLAHMKLHAALIRPKFEAVLEIFGRELTPCGIANWTKPNGGYFISLDLPEGTAKRTYDLAKAAGVTLTNVGATFPYGRDEKDCNLRIAPTFPTIDDLVKAAEVMCVCAKIADVEKLLAE